MKIPEGYELSRYGEVVTNEWRFLRSNGKLDKPYDGLIGKAFESDVRITDLWGYIKPVKVRAITNRKMCHYRKLIKI